MCGIVGYIGPKPCVPVIMEGLARLEYRGYDSAGIAVAGGGHALQLRRAPGKLRNLADILARDPVHGTYGIGHTRWATHGRPTEENAHPHRDGTGTLVVVHNGIVENYLQLKTALIAKGHKFLSETDTEIIAHVIQDELELAELELAMKPGAPSSARSLTARKGGVPSALITTAYDSAESLITAPPSLPLEEAVRRAVQRLTGAFAIGVLSAHEPDKMVAARLGPPIVLGLGDGEFFLASDVPGILHHTRDIYFLNDGEVATLTTAGVVLTDFDANPKVIKIQRITWDPIQAEKAGYKHFMLKEINEQPRAVRDTTLGRVSLDTGRVFLPDMKITPAEFRAATGITIAACGTSWHAGLAGKFMIERLARLPVDVDYASEYRYRDPIPNPRELGLLITQSGETADTIAAQHELIAKGSKTLAICNVVGSAVTRLAQGVITTNAGPEIGVASTKAFTAQLTALFTLALYLAQVRGTISDEESLKLVTELTRGLGVAETSRIRKQQNPKSTLYLLEEPTIGLHMADVHELLKVLHRLVDDGNTVVVIEHNISLVAAADYVIDIGPEAGDAGGNLVVAGTPEQVAKCKTSHTAPFLRDALTGVTPESIAAAAESGVLTAA